MIYSIEVVFTSVIFGSWCVIGLESKKSLRTQFVARSKLWQGLAVLQLFQQTDSLHMTIGLKVKAEARTNLIELVEVCVGLEQIMPKAGVGSRQRSGPVVLLR